MERVKSLMSELKTAPSLNDALLSMPSKQLSSNPVDSAAAARFKSFVRGAFDGRSLSAQAQQRSVEDRALAHIETFRKVRAIRQRKWYASMYIDRNVAEPIALVPAAEERSAVAKSDAQTAPGRRGTHSKGTAPFDRSRMAYDWKEGIQRSLCVFVTIVILNFLVSRARLRCEGVSALAELHHQPQLSHRRR